MLKTLARSIREYKRPSILAPLFIACEVIVECILPFVTAELINSINNGSDMPTLLKYGGLLLIFAFVSLGFGVLSAHFCSIASCGFAKNLRHDLFYAVQDFSFNNIDKFSSASLVTRLTTDVANIQMAYMMIIRTAVRSPLMLVSALSMAILLSPKVSLAFAIIIPFLAAGLLLIIKSSWGIFHSVFKKYDALNASIQENVSGIRVVKAFVREDYEIRKFNSASDEIRSDFTKAEKILALNSPLMQFCTNALMIVIFAFGSTLIVKTNELELAVGDLASLSIYGMQIFMSLMMLSMIIVMIAMSVASAKRVCEVLREVSTITSPENAQKEVPDGSIRFENVSFKYSEKATKFALEGIDLTINEGETVGIIGGTGSSKSSLVQLIPRLYDATQGTVLVGGVDVREYDLDTLRSSVAMVLQKNILFSGTIKENLRWGDPNATDEQIKHACTLACADEFIENFPDKYDTVLTQGGTNVSGGQKQRLCIARALLKKPKILILDDSTSAVDTKTDAKIRYAFRNEIPNTTKIIIAQRVSSVMDADKIIVMENGRIEAVGNHEYLLKNSEIYREVYDSQMRGGDQDEE